jgi:hypothetical protein
MNKRHYQNVCYWLAYLGSRLVAMLILLLSFLGSAFAADHAVILMYHRFGEDRLPRTNIRLDQFDAHLEKLSNGNYSVWPLAKIVDHLQKGHAASRPYSRDYH